jgi:hypothetical protein
MMVIAMVTLDYPLIDHTFGCEKGYPNTNVLTASSSLYSIMFQAPLLIGCDVKNRTSETLEILSNKSNSSYHRL